MKELIYKNITGKKVLILFILTNIIYALMLVITIPKVMHYSQGMKLLDMLPFGYNTEYVISLFSTLGEKGRYIYLFNQIPLDMVYPFLFGISYCLVLAYFLNRLNSLKGFYIYLCLLPVIGGIADYSENIGIIYMLNHFPDISKYSVGITEFFSIMKSMCTTIYFVILIIVFTIFTFRTIIIKALSK